MTWLVVTEKFNSLIMLIFNGGLLIADLCYTGSATQCNAFELEA